MSNNTSARRRALEDRNRQLVEWTLAVIGIFWGVWWGFFVNKILDSKRNIAAFVGLPVPKTFFLVVSALYVGLLVYTLVHWMWSLRSLNVRTAVAVFFKGVRPTAFVLGGFIAAVYVVSDAFGLGIGQAVYGTVLSLLWPVVTYAVLLRGQEI